jgi:hypothetical protein
MGTMKNDVITEMTESLSQRIGAMGSRPSKQEVLAAIERTSKEAREKWGRASSYVYASTEDRRLQERNLAIRKQYRAGVAIAVIAAWHNITDRRVRQICCGE